MRPSTLKATLKALASVQRSALIEGSPGLGKTQLVQQIADELHTEPAYREGGFGFKQLHAPLMQPEDYGMPVVSADRENVKFVVPASKFPIVGSDCPDHGILLVDELPQADNAGQKILANLIQEREIHGQRLKPGWTVFATGNRQKDRAGANRILSHLRSRVTTYEFEPSLDDWCDWAIRHEVNPGLISFMRFKPGLLAPEFDPQLDINPTPRAWVEGVSKVIDVVPKEAEFDSFKGAVGEGAAGEFVAFLQIVRQLPNPDAVLLDPANAEVPTDPSTLYAIAGAIAHRASAVNFERVMTYATRLPPEFTVLTVRDSVRKDAEIQNSRAFIDWAIKAGADVLV